MVLDGDESERMGNMEIIWPFLHFPNEFDDIAAIVHI